MDIKEATEYHIPEMIRVWIDFMYFNSEVEPYDTKSQNIIEQVGIHFKNKINSPDSLVLVAIEDEHVVGYSYSVISPKSAAEPDKYVGCIYDMAVTSNHRNKGIGKEMLATIKDWFASHNACQVELSTLTKRTINESFWANQGLSTS